ncbi:hypothetical protein PP175_23470 [Aneurinibacillus sp. Ricciae_BoGa-3]|uniref:hypothetical protein n=1 Tax=Aneurinibacillus sp. Ricciae_BoGa-3 TaxID=3022697 RepID=UPI00233FD401|nr:hypothetical protein [Aneurinibacillus sp. Ricciae_BoGa-3]WCK54212.1 hypothetical protein PP175_23470 [Aneurinibacillus sp. Ricciae_BoGa-3]
MPNRLKNVASLHVVSPHMYINPSESTYYEKLLRINSHNPRALYQLGLKAEKAGYNTIAKKYYEKSASVGSYQPALGALILLKQKERKVERIQQQKRQEAFWLLDEQDKAREGRRTRSVIQSLIVMLFIYLITIVFVMGILLK